MGEPERQADGSLRQEVGVCWWRCSQIANHVLGSAGELKGADTAWVGASAPDHAVSAHKEDRLESNHHCAADIDAGPA
jgi:hypothetical protein